MIRPYENTLGKNINTKKIQRYGNTVNMNERRYERKEKQREVIVHEMTNKENEKQINVTNDDTT